MPMWGFATIAATALAAALGYIHRHRDHGGLDVDGALHDPERLAAVRALSDGGRIDVLDELARRAASQVGAPSAAISLLDADDQHLPGHFGLGGGRAALARAGLSYDYSFCKYVVATRRPVDVPNTLRDPRMRSHRAVTERGVRAFLGVPLRDRGGHIVGTVSVVDTFPHPWTADDHASLTRIAQLAMRELERPVETDETMVAAG